MVFSGLLSSRIAATTGIAQRAATATRRLPCTATEYDSSTAGSSEPLPSDVPTVNACTAERSDADGERQPGPGTPDQHRELPGRRR